MPTGQVLSIGYGNASREEVLSNLSRSAAGFVIDVRSAPYSRFQPDFNRESIEAALRDIKIKYVFMGDALGGRPADDKCYTDGKVDYSKTRTKEFFRRGIERLKAAYEQGLTICLLCSEAHPAQCHRSKLIGTALAESGIDVIHILPDGTQATQADVIAEVTHGQHSLFEENFVSRNKYR